MMATLPEDGSDVWVAINARVATDTTRRGSTTCPSRCCGTPGLLLRRAPPRSGHSTRLRTGGVHGSSTMTRWCRHRRRPFHSWPTTRPSATGWRGPKRDDDLHSLPRLLGTYGDGATPRGGRAGPTSWPRGRAGERGLGDEVPDASLYLLGGGEDGPQRLATDLLRGSSFVSRVRDGANVLAVCAGLQILGMTFCVEATTNLRDWVWSTS